jgi:hypothetical protein
MKRSLAVVFGIITLAMSASNVACSSSSSTGNSGNADCPSLCTAAQAGNCTTIKGNCESFCSALATVDSEASCASPYNAYESCLGTPSTVCSNSCGAQESALQNCVTPYCAAHTSEASCSTLASSF